LWLAGQTHEDLLQQQGVAAHETDQYARYPPDDSRKVPVMKATLLSGILAAAIVLAAPAHADVDTDFANQLHTYGIYGQKDYNAWLGKITCERLYKGVDTNAEKSAVFLSHNLPRGTNTEQTWQFLGAAINTYCPDQQPFLAAVAGQNR
jgi:Protein of unknown function (DUF732)